MKKALMLSILGYLFLLVVILDIGFWIYIALDDTMSFQETKERYLSYFPDVVADAFLLTIMCIVLLMLAAFLLYKAIDLITLKGWRTVNKGLIGVACILLFWQIFSLM